MGISYNPRIVTDGLVLALDAGNSKGFDDDENLLAYSEDFSNAYWTKSNVSVTANAIASPTGSSNASKLVESASTAVHELFRSDGALGVGSDTYITFSIFAKAAERQYCYIRSSGNSKRIAVVVDLSNGTFNVTNWGFTLNSSATVTPYPNGWYRITATAQSNYPAAPGWNGIFIVSPLDSYQLASNVGGGGYSYAGNGTSGIYIWGAHYEFGPGISNYYATTGTAKNRGTTLIDMTGRGNNGTLLNGPTSSTDNGGVLNLDGSNDYINSYNDSNLFVDDNSLTVSIFANINEASKTGRGGLVSSQRYQGEPDPGGYGLCIFDGTQLCVNLTKRISGVDNSYEGLCAFTYIRQQFKYYSFTYNNSTKTVTTYMNGVQQATSTNASYGWTLNTTNRITRIGINWQGGWGTYYNMKIGAVHIHNRALTAAEIQQNFNATRGRFGI